MPRINDTERHWWENGDGLHNARFGTRGIRDIEDNAIKEVSMPSISTFVCRVPSEILRSYFEKTGLSVDSIDWSAKSRDLAARIKKVQSELGEQPRARLLNDIERI